MKTALSILIASLLIAGSAYAAPPPTGAATAEKGKKKGAQVFDFEGDVIESEFLRPNSALVETVKKRAGLSLVRIKTSFLDKILATVDEL
jgi:hypothetical protein